MKTKNSKRSHTADYIESILAGDTASDNLALDSTTLHSICLEDDTDKNPYQCMICLKRFSRNGHLVKHSRVHSGEKPFECELCGRSFTQSGHLKTHMSTHTGEKPFSCDVCGKNFTTHTSRKRHRRIHTGEKPYACAVCQKAFSDRWHLKEHSMSHTIGKPFQCQKCLKEFSRKASLNMHLRTHEEKKSWMCGICKTTYYLKRNLNRHFLKFHGDMDPRVYKVALQMYPGAERGIFTLAAGITSEIFPIKLEKDVTVITEVKEEDDSTYEVEEILPTKSDSQTSSYSTSFDSDLNLEGSEG